MVAASGCGTMRAAAPWGGDAELLLELCDLALPPYRPPRPPGGSILPSSKPPETLNTFYTYTERNIHPHFLIYVLLLTTRFGILKWTELSEEEDELTTNTGQFLPYIYI